MKDELPKNIYGKYPGQYIWVFRILYFESFP